MDRLWITNGSIQVAPVVNPLAAACETGFVPTDIHILDNPTVGDIIEEAESLMKTIVTAHGGDEPAVTGERIDDETDFDAIIAYLREAIDAGNEADAEIAVDVTPGRKLWSIISFRAGFAYDVDHVYYLHVKSNDFFGRVHSTIPRPAAELIDFLEVV